MMGMFPFPSETGPPGFAPFPALPGAGRNTRATGRMFTGDDRGPQIQTGNIQE